MSLAQDFRYLFTAVVLGAGIGFERQYLGASQLPAAH